MAKKMPRKPSAGKTSIKPFLTFAAGASASSVLWTACAQADKFIVSGLVPLAEYGFFALATAAASILIFISSPLTLSVMPRLTAFRSKGDIPSMLNLYRRATNYVAIIVAPVTVIIAFHSEAVILVWTNDLSLASIASPILAVYILGSALSVMSGFVYFIQYAHGSLNMHSLGACLFLALLLPVIIVLSKNYGVTGAALAWTLVNGLFFLIWVPIVHRKYVPSLHMKWLTRDVVPPFLVSASICTATMLFNIESETSRLTIGAWLLLMLLSCIGASAVFDSRVRRDGLDLFYFLRRRLATKSIIYTSSDRSG